MANPWFRMYSEFQDDPKVQMLSEAMQRRLLMLMIDHCKEAKLTDAQRAFVWRISAAELAETKKALAEFIDADWNLTNWAKRQFISDSSTERVRKHRETLQKRPDAVTVTPPDTDTDTEAEKNKGDIARATTAHIQYLREGLQIPVMHGKVMDGLLELIDLEARNRGGPEAACEWLVSQGLEGKSRGEVVNALWLIGKKYEGKNGLPRNRAQQRSDGNDEAARRAIASILGGAPAGPSGGEAGGCQRENVQVIRPSPRVV